MHSSPFRWALVATAMLLPTVLNAAEGPDPAPPALEFDTVRTLPGGFGAYYVISADLRRCNTRDLVLVNNVSDDIMIYRNEGHGAFAAPVSRPTGGKTPNAVVAVDLDGDGWLDLAVSNLYSTNVSVFWNEKGSFDTATLYETADGPRFVAAADVDRDGRIDLITANQAEETVSVLRNLGGRKLQLAGRYPTGGTFAFSCALGDLNGDGFHDVIVGNLSSHNVSVLLNRKDGTFARATTYTTGARTQVAVLADLDGDKVLDIAAANGVSNSISVLRGKGDGTFAEHVDYHVPLPQGIFAIDVNCDGATDLVTANQGNDTVSVLLNRKDGTLLPRRDFQVHSRYPLAVHAADLNGDGRVDVVTANFNYGNVSVLFNGLPALGITRVNPEGGARVTRSDHGVLSLPISAEFNVPVDAGTLSTRNFLVYGSQSGFHAGAIRSEGKGKVARFVPTTSPAEVGSVLAPGAPAIRLVADGREPPTHPAPFFPGESVNVVLTSQIKPTVGMAPNRGEVHNFTVSPAHGSGKFEPPDRVKVPVVPRELTTADFNHDGHLDVALLDGRANVIQVMLGNGQGKLEPRDPFPTRGKHSRSLITADLDGDAKLDLVAINTFSSDLSIFYGQGNGSFEEAVKVRVGAGPRAVTAADLNGDGRIDLASADQGGYSVSVLLNRGGRAFGVPASYPPDHSPFSISAADLNGDKAIDLITANLDSDSISMFINNGDGTFTKRAQPLYIQLAKLAIVRDVDVDNDGRVDLIPVNMNSKNVAIMINKGDGTFEKPKHVFVGKTPTYAASIDFNGDGFIDLAVVDEGEERTDGKLVLLRNDRGKTFERIDEIPLGTLPSNILAGDFDEDGAVDIIVGNLDAKELLILRNSASRKVAMQQH